MRAQPFSIRRIGPIEGLAQLPFRLLRSACILRNFRSKAAIHSSRGPIPWRLPPSSPACPTPPPRVPAALGARDPVCTYAGWNTTAAARNRANTPFSLSDRASNITPQPHWRQTPKAKNTCARHSRTDGPGGLQRRAFRLNRADFRPSQGEMSNTSLRS